MEVDLFFHGNIDRETAECRLMLFSSVDGTYLIRFKDDDNYVLSVYFRRRIAHYLISKQVRDDTVRYVWNAERNYESLEHMVQHHTMNKDGLITTLTAGCPVRYFIIQDSLFPKHQCNGLCWFHGTITKEEIGLRLAVVDPASGSFLITNGNTAGVLYCLSVWLSGNVIHQKVREKGTRLLITPDHMFTNLLDLVRHYQTDDSLGHVLTQPCCVSVWLQRGHLSHPPQILTDFRQVQSDDEDTAPSLQRKDAIIRSRKLKANNFNLNISNISNLSLSDNESTPSEHDVDVDGRGLGFFNVTYSSDEESQRKGTKDAGVTLELPNTLSRKGSRRIKRKSLEKSQRQLQKIQASRSRRNSSDDEIAIDSPMSDSEKSVVNPSKLKRRNAKEKKRNKKNYLSQAEVDSVKCHASRLALNPNDILWTEQIGSGISSKVYKGSLHQVPVSIKKVNKSSSKWIHEIGHVEHDSVVRLIGFEKEKLIVTELCELGSLDLFLLKNDKKVTSPLNVLMWLRDICSALLYLDTVGVSLRALSCRNIVLNNALCAKLSIYSTTRHLSEQETHKIRWYPTDNKTCIEWSFGITLLEAIHYAQFKYKDLLEMYNNGAPTVSFQPHVPLAVRNLVKSCIRQRHADRPKLKTIKEKLDVILDIIIKAYNWRVTDATSLFHSLNLEQHNHR